MMINIKLGKEIKFVFLPALVLSLLLSFGSTFFTFSQNAMIEGLGSDRIATFKTSSILPQIILTISLLVFGIYKPFEKIFKSTLLILTGTIALLTLLIFFQDRFTLKIVSETDWLTSLMYIILNIFHLSLNSVFIWGFINRLSCLSAGIKYYIPLAFLLSAVNALGSDIGLTLLGDPKWPLMVLLISGTLLMLFSLLAFNLFWKRLPDNLIHPEISPVSTTRFPFLSAAYLLAGFAMIGSILTIIFKSQLKNQFSNASDYSHFIGHYSMYVTTATVAFSIIWAVLGTWLILKKGWKTTALYGSLSILIGGILFLSIQLPLAEQGLFKGLLTATAFGLFFPLIQVLYLYLPYQYRFKTKIITEMVASPIMKALPSLIVQGLLAFFGSMASVIFYLKILTLILIILLVFASFKARHKTVDIKN